MYIAFAYAREGEGGRGEETEGREEGVLALCANLDSDFKRP